MIEESDVIITEAVGFNVFMHIYIESFHIDLQIIQSICTGTLSEEWPVDVLIKSKNCTRR